MTENCIYLLIPQALTIGLSWHNCPVRLKNERNKISNVAELSRESFYADAGREGGEALSN
jgi:hypothetical protein